jgi:hypothetical protein
MFALISLTLDIGTPQRPLPGESAAKANLESSSSQLAVNLQWIPAGLARKL